MKKKLKYLAVGGLAFLLLLNVLIAIQAYNFTHFDPNATPLPGKSIDLSFGQKVKIIFSGAKIPKPKAGIKPEKALDITIPVEGDKSLSAWLLQTDSVSLGMVLAFHGYVDEKSAMLPQAGEILKMGYDVLLVDFMGTGDSYGVQTTIGYLEGDNVVSAYRYVCQELKPEGKIFLMGFSMGAAAVMKALCDKPMEVAGAILQAPYSTLHATVGSRADLLGAPREPISALFTFWIGAVNGFNGFDLAPIRFAEKITVPVLYMSGKKDQYIPIAEAQSIYNALGSTEKSLILFDNSIHEDYLLKHREGWVEAVKRFTSQPCSQGGEKPLY